MNRCEASRRRIALPLLLAAAASAFAGVPASAAGGGVAVGGGHGQPSASDDIQESSAEALPPEPQVADEQAPTADEGASLEPQPQGAQAAADPFDPANDPAVPAQTADETCTSAGGFGRITVCTPPEPRNPGR